MSQPQQIKSPGKLNNEAQNWPQAEGSLRRKSEWLSTRITKETRKALENAAARNGLSLSQEIERRIAATFEDFRKDRDRFTSAFGYLLSQVALMLPMGGDFRTDRLKHEALVAAAVALLKRLEPKDPPILPAGVSPEDALRQAQEIGVTVAAVVWKQLGTMPPVPRGHEKSVPEGSWLYAYEQARRDLGVEFDEAGTVEWLKSSTANLAKALMEKGNKDE